ncbi:MAG: hypothetical protein KAG94_02230 [Clostridiales bacterium]|nr:hypothetical protein [Clostridiales bacterium]
MNKLGYFIVIIGVILLIALAVFVVMSIGTKVDVELDCIQYRLGIDNIEYEELITLKFEGRYVNSFLAHIFVGDVYIDGYKLNNIPGKKTSLDFNKYNSAQLYDTNDSHGVITTDRILINDDFSKMAICINEEGSWNSSSGLMMAAPASSREQAIAISNEVMDSFLQKELE